MRNLMNSNQSYTGLVQKYIGSAYDNVYAVSQHLQLLKDIAESLDNGDLQNLDIFIKHLVEVLEFLDIFNNSFYGARDVEPTTRPDGTAMVGGDIYYNTPVGGLFVYSIHSTGAYNWVAFDAAHTYQETIVANTSNQSLFTLSKFTYEPDTGNLSVYVSGLRLTPEQFTEPSPTTVLLADSVNIGTTVEFLYAEKLGGDGANLLDAVNVTFNPSATSLTSTDVQNAIVEVYNKTGNAGSILDAGTF